MKISEKIKSLRLKSGFTQDNLASRLGVSAQSVSKWENEISMPDISLLPLIAETFGVSIDDLFDLTVEEKLNRIENRIEIEENFSDKLFVEYESFLNDQLNSYSDRARVLSLLANLYHKRMESDSKIVSKLSKESIKLDPSKKACQWLLIKAEGHAVWDWNFANHNKAIEFYKEVIDSDREAPKSPLPYYYLIDNLLADNRADEASYYLEIFKTLPAHKPIMYHIYRAYIALSKHDAESADKIIEKTEKEYGNDEIFLFEAAQYYARKCEYDIAIKYYERVWNEGKTPRYTDPLHALATIFCIKGDIEKAVNVYDKMLISLIEEWGYSKEDGPYIEAENEKNRLLNILAKS